MATIAPSTIKNFDDASLEKIAYKIVSTIPTKEPNDQLRLGYCLWKFLSDKVGTLEDAINSAGARTTIEKNLIEKIIRENLKSNGIEV